MKKLLSIIAVILFFGCSPDDNNSDPITNTDIVKITHHEVNSIKTTSGKYRHNLMVYIENESYDTQSGSVIFTIRYDDNIQWFGSLDFELEGKGTEVLYDSSSLGVNPTAEVRELRVVLK